MTRLVLFLSTMLILFIPNDNTLTGVAKEYILNHCYEQKDRNLTEMEALDHVKIRYASNFIKLEQAEGIYYYKLPEYEYYLSSEGVDQSEEHYLIHLYEYVLDDEATGIGHMVTYGWYLVDINSGIVTDVTQ